MYIQFLLISNKKFISLHSILRNSIKKPHKHEILLDVQIPHAWNKQKQYQTMLLVTFLYLYMEQNFPFKISVQIAGACTFCSWLQADNFQIETNLLLC
jgi:hypothetical protein